MLDTVLKLLALVVFIGYIAIVPIFVPEPPLIIVCVIVGIMAIYDFLIYPALRRRRRL
jgi:hypothetical protein